jgi:hypothetical protein
VGFAHLHDRYGTLDPLGENTVGAKYLIVLCAGSTLLLVQSYAPNKGAIYKLFGAVAKLASINLRKLVLSPTGSINLGFILREDLLLCSSYLPLGVPNGAVIYTPSSKFSGAVAGEKEGFCKGSLSLPIFYFVIVLLYFIFACIFLSKIQKN